MTGLAAARRMRFRLDPKDADAPVAPPAQVRPAGPTAPQAATPATAAAPTRWPKKRLLVVALIGLVLLGGGAGAILYATDSGPFRYPHAYLVEGDHVPSGLKLAPVPDNAENDFGIKSNPGEVPKDRISEMGDASMRPQTAWIEVLGTTGTPSAITILALQFEDEDHADSFASAARFQCQAGAHAVLQDGDVVVLISSNGASTYYSRIVNTIMGQVSGLHKVCG